MMINSDFDEGNFKIFEFWSLFDLVKYLSNKISYFKSVKRFDISIKIGKLMPL